MNLYRTLWNAAVNLRPFGLKDTDSLMNLARLGTLRCHCVPTDAAEESSDRRSSCRACGNAIVASDAARLYERQSRAEIWQITQRLRRAAINAQTFQLSDTRATEHFTDHVRELSGRSI